MATWSDVLLEAARAIADRRYRSALDRLSEFLRDADSADERREALGLRATVLRRLGDIDSARRDLELAHSLSRSGESSRYAIELLMARVARDGHDFAAARSFLSQALRTAVAGRAISAGGALEGFIQLAEDSGFTDEESALVRNAIRASWEALRLEGPIPGDVAESVQRISGAEGRPLR